MKEFSEKYKELKKDKIMEKIHKKISGAITNHMQEI